MITKINITLLKKRDEWIHDLECIFIVCFIPLLAAIRDYQEITSLKQDIGELKTQILEMKNNQ